MGVEAVVGGKRAADARIVYGCVTSSLDRVQRYVVPHVGDRELILMWNQRGMGSAYNKIIHALRGRDVDALVLVHDDLEIIDPDVEQKVLDALALPRVGLVGVAGGYDITGLAWWNARTVGWQRTDSGSLDFGQREGYVTSVEGSFMALGVDVLRYFCDYGEPFDEQFDEFAFHGYDDIGMTICSRDLGVYVADIKTHHHTSLGFTSSAGEQQWLAADRAFRAKWKI